MKIREFIDETSKTLMEMGREGRSAIELIKYNLNLESYELYAKLEDEIAPNILERIQKDVDKYIKGVPLQHIVGYETFLGRDFIVNSNVLIPRYETEELVENVLYHIDDYFADYEKITIADIGCGSGAIGLTLALEESRAKVYATDISHDAIEVAAANSTKFDADVEFFQGDMLEPLINGDIKLDILVSNPPYIPNDEKLESIVKDFEPNVALFGGEDGVDFYRKIFEDARKVLNKRALLAFEIGYNQRELISKEVEKYFPEAEYEILKDINGKDRMLFIYFNIER